MHCLWLTLADPEPATNGQLIYSRGLIEAARAAGAKLWIVGLARSEKAMPPSDGNSLAWRLVDERKQSRRQRLLSPLPDVASRGCFPEMARVLGQAINECNWDAVVFDSICAGWALKQVLHHCRLARRRPRMVYLAHNHEVTVARRIADAARGAKRLLKEIDARKVMRLERRLVGEADLVTSNTPEDRRAFIGEAGRTPVALLPPGYDGPRMLARTIDARTPRRAVVVGSFDWPPKRISLEQFLAAAAPVLQRSNVELQVVGAVEPAYLADLRARHPSVTFIGPVDDVRPYMAAARIALVPDLLGGFKLKGLDYVFNRVPILSMRIALPGMPLQDGRSIGLFDSHEALAQGIVSLIDDFPELNRRQALAFDACAARFDWAPIGRHLLRAITRLGPADQPSTKAREGVPSSSKGSGPVPAAAER